MQGEFKGLKMSILPDVLDLNLKVVFCGTAAGNESANQRAYYAGRGNQFWDVLYRVGLTPRKLKPKEYRELLKYEIGLTDLLKVSYGSDRELASSDYDIDGFKNKILRCSPAVLAFNGKTSAKICFGRKVNYTKCSVFFIFRFQLFYYVGVG